MARIVITGASRGIGRSAALTLADAGHSVVATMRSPKGQASFADALPIQVETMDVDNDESVRACFTRIFEGGPVDVLVNNAGIERIGSVEETPLADWRACMETNYFGALRCIQAVVGSMRGRRRGQIINISSVAGRISLSPMTPYSASKFALEAVSEALAQELMPFGVRVAIIEPGITETDMARSIANTVASAYPHRKRVAALFSAVLSAGAAPPELVAQRILDLVQDSDSRLRHPATPDAGPFLAWRSAMNDEEWTRFGAQSDQDWSAAIKRDFGLDVNL
ncbi:MAG TPA: SDR family oxidoreductase [Bryobacteraceae bacterium]|nr:SDR family oxidoreductase [Bryobacteraceae bacterium]